MSAALAVALMGLTSLALAILLVPLLLRQRRAEPRDGYSLAVYRDQLAEIERDLGRGVLEPAQAEAARAEIGRRILALKPEEVVADNSAGTLAVAVVAILFLPVAAWAFYLWLGSPAAPDQPFASRGDTAPDTTTVASSGAPHVNMNEAVQRLTAYLKQKPDDLNAWVLLARSNINLQHYADAAEAYRHAVELSGNQAEIVGDRGEALVMAAGGTVTPEARQAFETALGDPENAPRSRYYLALAQLQAGDAKTALKEWTTLEAKSPADAEWLPLLRQRIAQAAGALGIEPPPPAPKSPVPKQPAAAPPATAGAPPPTGGNAPNPAAVAAAAQATANASPEERQSMITAMVERLAARLETQPDDVEGWTRLGRSYMVLNEPQKARDAYARALKLKPDDPALKQGFAAAQAAAGGK